MAINPRIRNSSRDPYLRPLLMQHAADPLVAAQRQVMVDVDHTLFPFYEALKTVPAARRVELHLADTYETLPSLIDGGHDAMAAAFLDCMRLEVMRRFPLYPGALDAARRWKAHGITIHVITARPYERYDDTLEYLIEQGYPLDSYHCSPDPDKLALCQQQGIEVLVDDHPHLLARAHQAGLSYLSLRMPYNRASIDQHGTEDAHGWDELGADALWHVERRVRKQLTALDRPGMPS